MPGLRRFLCTLVLAALSPSEARAQDNGSHGDVIPAPSTAQQGSLMAVSARGDSDYWDPGQVEEPEPGVVRVWITERRAQPAPRGVATTLAHVDYWCATHSRRTYRFIEYDAKGRIKDQTDPGWSGDSAAVAPGSMDEARLTRACQRVSSRLAQSDHDTSTTEHVPIEPDPELAGRERCKVSAPIPEVVYVVEPLHGDTVQGRIEALLCDRPDGTGIPDVSWRDRLSLAPVVVVSMPGGRRAFHAGDLIGRVRFLDRDNATSTAISESRLMLRGRNGHLEPAALSYPCGGYGCLDGVISGQGQIDEERAQERLDSINERARVERERRDARARAEAAAKARAEREAKAREAEAKARADADAAERKREASIRARWPPRMADLVVAHEVAPGMTPAMVLESWGRPDHVNRTITAFGRSEQWVYGSERYVYFENDVVTSIQTSE